MNVLIHIPARAGSKRLPGKNLRTVGGKSLVAHAAECAKRFSGMFDEPLPIVIDTDSQDIADEALEHGAHAWLQRPADVAGDDATSAETVLSAIKRMGGGIDAVVLLQPTSPLRSVDDVRRCWRAFAAGADSVVTVRAHTAEPDGSVYITRVPWLRRTGRFHHPYQSLLVPVPASRSCDINTEEDLARAESLLRACEPASFRAST